MADAGYGNHTNAAPAERPGPKPGAESTDRPAADLRGGDDPTLPTLSGDDRRDEATPGAGAMPDGPQGGDVDPGAG